MIFENDQAKNKPINRDTTDPLHPNWLNTFGLYTWWKDKDGKVFVIVARWLGRDPDKQTITIVRQDNEEPIERPYKEIFDLFKKGMIQRTSRSSF